MSHALTPCCSHAAPSYSLRWLTASMWSLWCGKHDSPACGSFPHQLERHRLPSTNVKGGPGGCNICVRAGARMSSVWCCETLGESHKTPHSSYNRPLIRFPGRGGWWLEPNRISPPIAPFQYQHGFRGYSATVNRLLSENPFFNTMISVVPPQHLRPLEA